MRRGVRSGELDIRITIQSVSSTADEITNESVVTYSTLAALVPAKRLGPASKEGFEANQQVALGTARYMIRRRTDINEQMRIVDGLNTYYISGIEDFGRMGYQILTAGKRDNE